MKDGISTKRALSLSLSLSSSACLFLPHARRKMVGCLVHVSLNSSVPFCLCKKVVEASFVVIPIQVRVGHDTTREILLLRVDTRGSERADN